MRRLVLALTLIAAAPPLLGQETPGPQPSPSPPPAHADGRRTMSKLVPNLGRASIGLFSTDNLWPLLIGSAATGIGSAFDDNVRDAIAKPDDPTAKAAGFSFGAISAVGVAGVFVGGRYANGERFRAASYDMLVATAVNAAFTVGIKAAVGRERPDGSNNQSFPSGHTSNAFAIAAALDGQYGKKVTIPAYAIATAVGVSRLRLNKHWLSDTLAGATLGYIVGRTTARVDGKPLAPTRTEISVVPMLGEVQGALIALRF